ncbi:MAG: hypothetical protein ACRDJU_04080 [Actinomycetota bacterium]
MTGPGASRRCVLPGTTDPQPPGSTATLPAGQIFEGASIQEAPEGGAVTRAVAALCLVSGIRFV